MKFCSLCLGLVAAVLFLPTARVRSQDISIDELLKRLPPPEKLAKSAEAPALDENDPAAKDPLAKEVIEALRRQDGAQALKASRQLIARYPKSAGAYCMNATICSALGKNGEAAVCLRKAIDLRPDQALPHFLFANLEISQRRYDAALLHLRKAAELDPKNPIVLVFLSQCAEKVGQRQEGLDYAKRATVAAPAFVGGWFQLARVAKALGHTEEALSALGRAGELSPDNAELLASVGYSYLDENRSAEAVPFLQRAAQLAPEDFLLQSQLGYCLMVTGRLDAAISHLKKGASLNPKGEYVWEHLGHAYQEQGKHREAINALKKATQITPARRSCWDQLAREYRAVGDDANANRAAARAERCP